MNRRQPIASASPRGRKHGGEARARRCRRPHRFRGYTLMEIATVLAILSILVSVALPSYSGSVMRVNRTAAERFMLDIANRQEQFLMDTRSYTTTIGSGGLGLTPEVELAVKYAFTVALTGTDCAGAALAGPAYVITGTAIGGQSADGNLCLDSRNNRTPSDKWQR